MPTAPTRRPRPTVPDAPDPAATAPKDAIAFLKAEHAQVAAWFDDYPQVWDPSVKMALATRICGALRIHATLEEEIFYPAFLEAVNDKALHHQAIVEHAEVRNLIAEIESSDPRDEYYDARVKVLADMVRRHVREEEKPKGLFALARKARVDLKGLGAVLEARRRDFIDPDGEEADE